MKMKEIREMTDESLAAKAKDLGEELFNLKFQHGIRPLENTAILRALKKEIARLQTVLNERRKTSQNEN